MSSETDVRVEAAARAIIADKADTRAHIGAFDYRPYGRSFCVRDHDAELVEEGGHVFLWRGDDGAECQRQYELAVARRLARLVLAAADAASPGRQDDVRDAVVEQARNLFQTFSGGMNVCLKCGKEETTTNWDYVQDLGSALAALDAEIAPPAGKVTP